MRGRRHGQRHGDRTPQLRRRAAPVAALLLLAGCEDPLTRPRQPPLTDGQHLAIGVAVALVVVVGAGLLVCRWPMREGGRPARVAAWGAGVQASGVMFASFLGTAISFRSRQLDDLAGVTGTDLPATIVQVSTSSDGLLWLVVLFGLPLAGATASTATGLARGESTARTTALVLAGLAVLFGLAFAFPNTDEVTARDRFIGVVIFGTGVAIAGSLLAGRRVPWRPEPASQVPGTVMLLQILTMLLLVLPCAIAFLLYLSGVTDPTGPWIAFMLVGVAVGFPLVAALGRRSKPAFVAVAVLAIGLAGALLATTSSAQELPVTLLIALLLAYGTLAPSTWRWFFSAEGA